MSALQSCMGGWCTKRDHCAHFHAASETEHPAERLCPPGQDGAGLQILEDNDMARLHFSTEARVAQVVAILTPSGITTAAIADAIGIRTESRMSLILSAAMQAGVAFRCRARVSDAFKAPETLYFPTAESRDAFMVKYTADKLARRREGWRRKGTRDRSAEIANRAAKRAAARAEREAKALTDAVARREQARMLRLAEAEQRKERARQEREAKAAAKQREKAEAAPVVVKARGPAFVDGPADMSRAKVTVLPAPPDRFDVTSAPRVISAQESRKWVEAVAA